MTMTPKRTRRGRRLLIALLVIILLPILLFVILGVIPAASDPILPPESIVVGAQANAGSATGIRVDFPEIVIPQANPMTPEKRELGRLLFFDPILSARHDMSCASCHHPDLGLSNGKPTATGADGQALSRNIPTLYEVAYKASLFWDGRAPDLETQIRTPMTAKDEMGAVPETVVSDLRAIPEYQALFAKAFPGQSDPLTFNNVTYALAAFERSLTAHDSPFDRYAKGDFTALTASQRRGFALFRSGSTACYACHSAPTFTNGKFQATGVPGADGKLDDPGRAAISGKDADAHAFMTPTLRNVALTAPYMHNGSFATLEEVIAFYAKGGGAGLGIDVPNLPRAIRPFTLSDQETRDLVNFLYALTDESARPAIPEKVPSGLPVVKPAENPAREVAKSANAGSTAATSRPPTTLSVAPNVTIQSVIDTAQAGDTVEIQYGVYSEHVLIDLNNITLRGVPNASGEWPVLDGKMQFADGITATGNNFTVEKLAIKNYQGNGVVVDGATGVILRDLSVDNASLYGVYPVHCTNVLIERVKATHVADAGIYVGQSRDIVVRNSEAYENVAGFEIENSVNAEVYDNYAYNNTAGISVHLLPQLPSKVAQKTRVYRNIIGNNNLANFGKPGSIVATVPEGTGIIILGADDVELFENTIRDNRSVGVLIVSLSAQFKPEELDVSPNPEGAHLHDNFFLHNGYQPAKRITDLGIGGADIIWDGSNWDMRFDDANATSFPPLLPSSAWPDLTRKAYWQIVNFVVSRLM
jgi:cytochrome c peroxidase